ncbi:DNA internalization-related competence protein ComEC/Rec2 [Candidatus Sumerlaeota bacterium]|nr:DNA internalization-related competence protein ComEC/Rec2 [Candidatus Sumerlaeota bacterium]
MKRPVFYLACSVLAGAVVGRIVELPAWIAWVLLAVCLVLAAAFAWRGRRGPSSVAPRAAVRFLFLSLFFVAFIQQNARLRWEHLATHQVERLVADSGERSSGEIHIEGIVAREPSWRDGRGRLIVVLRDATIQSQSAERAEPFVGRIQVTLRRDAAAALAKDLPVQGEGLAVDGRLGLAFQAAHLDLFDYRAYLLSHGISATMSVRDSDAVRRRPEGDTFEAAAMRPLMQWRRSTLDQFEKLPNSERAGAMRAMLLGETGWLDRHLRETFQQMGGAHLFAVSGLHTAMLALLIYALCRVLMVPPRPSAWIVLGFLALYCPLVGFRPPVVRASVMAACMTIPVLARRRVDTLTALCLAVFVTVLVNPAAPFHTDFQFSYACAFGIIVLSPTLREMLWLREESGSYRRRVACARYNNWVTLPLSVTLAAQLAVVPLLSIYFHQVSLIGFLSNLFMIPLAAIVLAAGWALSLLGPLSPAFESFFAAVSSVACGVFLRVAEWFADVPGASMHLDRFPWWMVGIWYAILFSGSPMRRARSPGAVEVRRSRLLLRLAALAALLAWWPVVARVSFPTDASIGRFRLTMLDVGQGDCLVLQLPDDKVLMVDTGPPRAARTVLEHLRTHGVDEILGLVLTHGDSDHIGSAADVIEAVEVAQVFEGSRRSKSEVQKRVDEAIEKYGVERTRIGRGERIRGAEPVRIDVLNPDLENPVSRSSNNQSIVLLAQYGAVRFLLMGDAEIAVERDLISEYGPAKLRSSVLKVGHHGSESSTSEPFAAAVRPRFALVSVGAGNRYGHPSPRVIERLSDLGARVLRTDEAGSVELASDGRRLWVRTTRSE